MSTMTVTEPTLTRLESLMNRAAMRRIAVKRIASILELMSDTGYSEASASIKNGHPEAEWQAKWWEDVAFLGDTLEKAAADLKELQDEIGKDLGDLRRQQ